MPISTSERPPNRPNVAQQKARAQQDNSGLEPTFIGRYAGTKNCRDADRVGDGQANEDGPQNIFNILQHKVVRLAVMRDELLNEFTFIAHYGQQQNSWNEAGGAGWRRSLCIDC